MEPTRENKLAAAKAAERLHHLSLRYAGAFVELAKEERVGLIRHGHPGLKEMRDLTDLILLTRAEINALTACLIKSGILDHNTFTKQVAEDYEWLAQQKAKQFGVKVTDQGLVFSAESK